MRNLEIEGSGTRNFDGKRCVERCFLGQMMDTEGVSGRERVERSGKVASIENERCFEEKIKCLAIAY